MNKLPRAVLLIALVLFAFLTARADKAAEKYTYVVVHGATAGGWEWKKTGNFLTADGHTVYRVTLTGLGERMHLSSPDIDLQTHINDVVNTILFEDLHDVVLTGHSYGGMVITGVMDASPSAFATWSFLTRPYPRTASPSGITCVVTSMIRVLQTASCRCLGSNPMINRRTA